MRGPSLQKTALLSFALHLTTFLIISLILRQSNHVIMSSPYTVNLVGHDISTKIDRGKDKDVVRETREPSSALDVSKKTKKEIVKETREIENRINQLKIKKEKIANFGKLRQISIDANNYKHGLDSKITSPSVGKGVISDVYYSKITREIWDQWNCSPSFCKREMEAIIAIKISRDGTATVQKIEKSSGNKLFDRSALQALAKANPLTPPPSEMEIGVVFHP